VRKLKLPSTDVIPFIAQGNVVNNRLLIQTEKQQSKHGTGGQKMTNEECAKFLIELHSDYFELAGRYAQPVVTEYAEAVAKAIMAMAERKNDGN
jgi:hypothetical protein